MKRIALLVAGLLVLLPVLALAEDAPGPDPKTMYKDFTLKDEAGNDFTLSKNLGKKGTVLVFANTACSACRGEAGALTGALGGASDVTTVFVISDMDADKAPERWRKVSRIGSFGIVVADPDYTVGGHYGVMYNPATVILGKDGKILDVLKGYTPANPEPLVEALKALK